MSAPIIYGVIHATRNIMPEPSAYALIISHVAGVIETTAESYEHQAQREDSEASIERGFAIDGRCWRILRNM